VTLEVMGGQVTRYPGNYAQYMEARVARHENLLAQKRNLDHKKEQLERFIDRFRYKATKAAQAQSRQKQLDKLEDIQVQSITAHGPRIRLPQPPRSGDEVVRLEDVSFSYDGKRDVVSHCDLRLMRGEHVALVGLNGMGKTTLLRLIAGRLAPTAGRVVTGTNVLPGYQSQDYAETMDPNATVYETAKSYASERSEADIRELLGGFGFSGEAIDKKVQVLSGGEKVRLGLARLLLKPLNFLMLDEPTTHLDIHAREALQEALSSYPGTIALVSHDIEFVRGIAKDIYDLRPGKVTRYYGDYDYYREKLAQEQAAQAAAELAANPPTPVPAIVPKNVPSAPKTVEKNVPQRSYKDQKRAESQLRQTFGKLKRPYESQVASCEEKIAALEKEQQEIYEKLNAPTADTDFAALNKRLAEINQESENETWRWEEASTSLEKLEEEFQERLAAIQRGEV
ncbi:MAG: ABC-F family ATP-binding cassette domain-containing protein, partial [Victivallales bacterium]|nr:ABC-F family ATP-binding cassette domain-containing protein [Victivallales bacterium]